MNEPIQIVVCKACGSKVSSAANFCPHCGQPAPFQSQTPASPPNSSEPVKRLKPHIPAEALTEEIWMQIEGYEGYFSVSSFGNVRSETRTIPHKRFGQAVHQGKSIIPTETKSASNAYCVVSFAKEAKQKMFLVHRLVALMFLDNPNDLPSVNHIDGNGLNNRLDNLEWTSPKNNTLHAYKVGLAKGKRGEQNSSSKLTEENVRQIRKLITEKTYSQAKIAKMFGVVDMVISDIKLGKTWKHII